MCWLQCVFSSYLDLKKKKSVVPETLRTEQTLQPMMSFEPWDSEEYSPPPRRVLFFKEAPEWHLQVEFWFLSSFHS